VLGGVIANSFGITAPYWAGFVVAVIVSAVTWRVFNRATVAEAYAEPAPAGIGADRAAGRGAGRPGRLRGPWPGRGGGDQNLD